MIAGVTDAARARFWAGLGNTRRRDLDALPGWEARLDAALDAAPRDYSADWIARDDLGAEMARRLESDGEEDVGRWWDHLRPADLYLACACARGVAAAIERFERIYGDEIARTARRFERPGLPADDLVQLLRAKLFAASPGEAADSEREAKIAPKIASYTGQGFLQNWVRVTTTRTFIDCCRRPSEAAMEVPIANELAARLAEPGADPELELLKREHAAHFKAAFAEAVGALDSSDRLVLKQHLVERLSIDQIGALYHLHRATAARRVARARDALLAAARAALARRLGLSAERLAGVLALVASRMDVSVERLLR
jgi:RNA polymerase sigma-70 factor (ECF subfamily)